jgi:hypothetical protein
MNELRELLPQLVPLAVEWAERVSMQAAATGAPLTEEEARLARRVGVSDPHKVRIAMPAAFPYPEHPLLRSAAVATGMLGPGMAGLTLGHTIFLDGPPSTRLLSHELRHVAQYEAAGSIGAFLSAYLAQIVHFGYGDAPYEVDARLHEIHEDRA